MSTNQNLDRLLAKLDAAGTQAAPIMGKGREERHEINTRQCQGSMPEDTGALRNSIRTRTEIKENIVTGDVYTNKAYADMKHGHACIVKIMQINITYVVYYVIIPKDRRQVVPPRGGDENGIHSVNRYFFILHCSCD